MSVFYWLRVVIAFAVAPLSPILTIGLFFKVVGGNWDDMDTFVSMTVQIAAMISYPAAILVGIPLFIRLYRKRIMRFWPHLGVATLCGFCTFPLLVFAYFQIDPTASFSNPAGAVFIIVLGALMVGAPLGAYAGLVFWHIARPDRRPAP